MATYDENARAAEEKLKPLITDEFLATLAVAVRTCGWSVDHVESESFARWCFDVAGKEAPDLSALDLGDDPARVRALDARCGTRSGAQGRGAVRGRGRKIAE